MKVLWLAPAFNHYKARFLNHLASHPDIDLTILSGLGRKDKGDLELDGSWIFNHIRVPVYKSDFGNSKVLKLELRKNFKNFDWVLVPAEKKNLFLLLYALKLRNKNKNVRLFSYNHPTLISRGGRVTILDKLITKLFYRTLDRVIFYTEISCDWAIKEKLIKSEKAYWANNTIDTAQVDKHLIERMSVLKPPGLLMIGRLLKYRRLNILFEYFKVLQSHYPLIELHVIGDGPEKESLLSFLNVNNNVFYHGPIIEEKEISTIMQKVDYVISTGHTGLSINHSFAYEKPYIAFNDYTNHPPEFGYLKNEINSLILNGDVNHDIKILRKYLSDEELYNNLVEGAIKSKSELTLDNWVNQIIRSLKA